MTIVLTFECDLIKLGVFAITVLRCSVMLCCYKHLNNAIATVFDTAIHEMIFCSQQCLYTDMLYLGSMLSVNLEFGII